MSECIDIFNEEFNYLGIATREEVHGKGLWHQTFHCWIVTEEKELIFQIRNHNKDFPNLLDISAAGHLLSGERTADGVRELKEELGIDVKFQELTSIGVIKEQIVRGTFYDNEHCHVFMYTTNRPIREYVIQEEELSGLVKIGLVDFNNLITGKFKQVQAQGFKLEHGEKMPITIEVKKDQFVPHHDNYYIAVCQAATKILSSR